MGVILDGKAEASNVGYQQLMLYRLFANSENDAIIDLVTTKGNADLYAKSCGN